MGRKLRSYKYNPDVGSLVNYGAFPQTYEDPELADPVTSIIGDGDPMDVLELSEKACRYRGQIMSVEVLGSFALIDDGETDWKVLARSIADQEDRPEISNEGLMNSRLPEIQNWFRMYKTAESKGENTIFEGGHLFSQEETMENIIEHTFQSWKNMRKRETHDVPRQTVMELWKEAQRAHTLSTAADADVSKTRRDADL